MSERAHLVTLGHDIRLANVFLVQVGKLHQPEKSENIDDFALNQFEAPYQAASPTSRQRPSLHSTYRHGTRTKSHRLDDIASSHEPAVDDNCGAAIDSPDHMRQALDGAAA